MFKSIPSQKYIVMFHSLRCFSKSLSSWTVMVFLEWFYLLLVANALVSDPAAHLNTGIHQVWTVNLILMNGELDLDDQIITGKHCRSAATAALRPPTCPVTWGRSTSARRLTVRYRQKFYATRLEVNWDKPSPKLSLTFHFLDLTLREFGHDWFYWLDHGILTWIYDCILFFRIGAWTVTIFVQRTCLVTAASSPARGTQCVVGDGYDYFWFYYF